MGRKDVDILTFYSYEMIPPYLSFESIVLLPSTHTCWQLLKSVIDTCTVSLLLKNRVTIGTTYAQVDCINSGFVVKADVANSYLPVAIIFTRTYFIENSIPACDLPFYNDVEILSQSSILSQKLFASLARPIDSASAQEIPMMLKALVSTVSR